MMVTQNGFRSYILGLIANERAKKAQIQKQLEGIDDRIAALETTMAIYDENTPNTQRALSIVSVEELKKSKVRKIPEALRFIAKRSGGNVHYGNARDLVIASGLSHGKARNVGSHIYNLMHESDEWEKVSPGIFRLKKKKRDRAARSKKGIPKVIRIGYSK